MRTPILPKRKQLFLILKNNKNGLKIEAILKRLNINRSALYVHVNKFNSENKYFSIIKDNKYYKIALKQFPRFITEMDEKLIKSYIKQTSKFDFYKYQSKNS